MKPSVRFRIGLILLMINQPIGWGALLICAALAVRTGRRDLYFYGIGIYIISWGMFVFGLFLTGREGIQHFRIWSKQIRTLFGRLFG